MRLWGLHPFTVWRLKRRVKGGVEDGTPRDVVAARLGDPAEKRPGEYPKEEIWEYHLGTIKGAEVAYCVLFDLDKQAVSASWWRAGGISQRRKGIHS